MWSNTASNSNNRVPMLSDLKSEDSTVRLYFVRNMKVVAESIGCVRFREEILPDLKVLLEDEDDILLGLAEELGKEQNINAFVGSNEYIHLLLSLLESLSSSDENAVREKAVESLIHLAPHMPENTFSTFLELVLRLSRSDLFSPKSSACSLFPIAYPRAPGNIQQQMLIQFKSCCQDITPMVRRTAATNLKKLIIHVDSNSVTVLVENFNILMSDDQDSVRLLAVENCVAIAQRLSDEEKNTIIKPVVLACGNDHSWRVRYMVANCFTQLVNALGERITQSDLVPVFVALLMDTEAEVRTAAASKISGVSRLLNRDIVTNDILPAIRQLVRDESSAVREALASDIMGLAPLYGREGTQEHLLDLFLLLLRDDTPEVRLNVMGKLNQVTAVFSLEQLAQHLLPALIELAEDRQWRVRLAAQSHIPHLAQELGVNFFNERILPICISWLSDCVFTIRESATVNFKNITRVFGVPWAQQTLLPRIQTQALHTNYLYRTVALTMISSLAEVFPATEIQQDLLPVVVTLSNDPISNIRINAIRTIIGLIPRLQPEYVNQTIIPFLNEKLKTERDKDVIFFTNRALQSATGSN